jgi:outer membrane lipoprotein-sorting protein
MIILHCTGLLLSMNWAIAEPSVKDIVERAEQSLQYDAQKVEMILRVEKKRRTKEYTLSLFRKEGMAAVEFHSPRRDRGTKFLRREEALWMYLPSIERTQRIAGHMLQQGIMGSDVSYEELLSQSDWTNVYTAELGEDETEQEMLCFRVRLTANAPKSSYARRELWIEKNHFIPIREQIYSASGTLLKEWIRSDIRVMDEWVYPYQIQVQDKQLRNSKTTILLQNIEKKTDLSEDIFLHRWLER